MIVQKEERGQPVSLRERVHFLDIVRGFALLGIIIVNYFLIVDSVKDSKWPPVTSCTIWFPGLPKGNSLHYSPSCSELGL